MAHSSFLGNIIYYFIRIVGPQMQATEIGTSAALLGVQEQIPRINSRQGPSYHTQRSTSSEYVKKKSSPSKIPRFCRSELLTTKNSLEKLAH